jgi:membrane protease YdiL (CAAX protease family)
MGLAVIIAPVTWFVLIAVNQPNINPGWPIIDPGQYLYFVFLLPLLEELAFRGILQDYFRHWETGRLNIFGLSVANIACSILFAASHIFYHSLAWSLLVILPSLIFGYCKDRYASVVPCVLLHCFYNSGYYLIFPP